MKEQSCRVVIIGAGPAGLSAAQVLGERGLRPTVIDAMPSPALKFLRAGRGGLNLSHGGDWSDFLSAYGPEGSRLEPALREFGPPQVAAWAESLGIATFTGTSGRLFPRDMGAQPLLRAWVDRLESLGVRWKLAARWAGFGPEDRSLKLEGRDGITILPFDVCLLALGGASWPSLGSRGDWTGLLPGVGFSPWEPANCGFETSWSPYFQQNFDRSFLKNVVVSLTDDQGNRVGRRGELMVRDWGLEGSPLYFLGRTLRQRLTQGGPVVLHLDLLPDTSPQGLAEKLARPRGKESFSTWLRKRTGLEGVSAALVREGAQVQGLAQSGHPADPRALAALLKALPLRITGPRPLEEAISSAGGLRWDELDEHLMLKKLPGVFCAGEMIDWEAPTGGYLLTACMALGRWAASGMAAFLASSPPAG